VAVARAFMGPARTTQAEALPVPSLALDLEAAAARLGEAIRIETVAQPEGAAAPDSAMLRRFHDWLVLRYPALHSVAERSVLAGGTLVYRWTGTRRELAPVVLMAHQDVVPAASPERWTHAPFDGVVEEGRVWGRGAIDNKGSLVAMLEAAEALAAGGRAPTRTVYFVFGHDEETRGEGAKAAAAFLVDRGVEAAFVLDEGSIVVADHPVTRGAVALVGITEKGYATVRLTAKAEGGHASAPPADTAVAILVRALDALLQRPFPFRYQGATRAMLEALAPHAAFPARLAISNAWLLGPVLRAQLAATPQGAAMLHTTMAPTMLSGSPRENVLASEAGAVINLRIAPGDTVEGVLAHLRQSLEGLPVTLEVVGEARDPAPVSAIDSEGYRLVAGAARAVFDVPVAPAPVIAATDSRHMTAVSANIYRFQPVLLPVAGTAMIHGIDEHLDVEALGQMIRFYGALLLAD